VGIQGVNVKKLGDQLASTCVLPHPERVVGQLGEGPQAACGGGGGRDDLEMGGGRGRGEGREGANGPGMMRGKGNRGRSSGGRAEDVV
jgi:hypothetical protein